MSREKDTFLRAPVNNNDAATTFCFSGVRGEGGGMMVGELHEVKGDEASGLGHGV